MKHLFFAIVFFAAGVAYSSYNGLRINVIKNSDGLQEAIDLGLEKTTKNILCNNKLNKIQRIINEKRD